ncbi:hypothetical protein [Dyadobacter alkalitolerans]|uniref:hypothetical protein n=1 Tax=Dyadobacter alkalitolerans TaxID=492736 RepID=UPI000428364A|nr:hypothetical protein [Dyadobacter alkalitolerans]
MARIFMSGSVDGLWQLAANALVRQGHNVVLHARNPSLSGLNADNPHANYSDSKFHNILLAMSVAREWADVNANAVDPGWVPTKMGGPGAPDNLAKGFETQVWLAGGGDQSLVSGQYFHHKRQSRYRRQADDASLQQKFIAFVKP